jgi:hypothetical protein
VAHCKTVKDFNKDLLLPANYYQEEVRDKDRSRQQWYGIPIYTSVMLHVQDRSAWGEEVENFYNNMTSKNFKIEII